MARVLKRVEIGMALILVVGMMTLVIYFLAIVPQEVIQRHGYLKSFSAFSIYGVIVPALMQAHVPEPWIKPVVRALYLSTAFACVVLAVEQLRWVTRRLTAMNKKEV